MGKAVYGQGTEGVLIAALTVATNTPVFGLLDLRALDVPSLVLIAAGGAGTLDGAWKIEVANDYVPALSGGTSYDAVSNAGNWVDITASAIWVDAIAAVAHGTAVSTKQYVQPKCPVGARALRVTFTQSAGSGTVSATAYAKSLGG